MFEPCNVDCTTIVFVNFVSDGFNYKIYHTHSLSVSLKFVLVRFVCDSRLLNLIPKRSCFLGIRIETQGLKTAH